jgi:hypothetical protein
MKFVFMIERNNYINRDNLCAKAIENFKETSSVSNWLVLYAELFNSVSIKPEGLPRITAYHFQGEAFENIKKFARLYDEVNSLYV